MSKRIIDASVLIGAIRNEPMSIDPFDIILGGVMSTVNIAEVHTKLAHYGIPISPKIERYFAMLERIEPFTARQAQMTGDLYLPTKHAGLSLGDRACLALAIDLAGEAYTLEEAWTKVSPGVKIHLLR